MEFSPLDKIGFGFEGRDSPFTNLVSQPFAFLLSYDFWNKNSEKTRSPGNEVILLLSEILHMRHTYKH